MVELQARSGSQFDPAVAAVLAKVVGEEMDVDPAGEPAQPSMAGVTG
jgi:hypothetical protein